MKALIVVDVQNDFLPGGALAVEKGDEIIPYINEIAKDYDLIVATQDWHPQNHKSFASQHAGHSVFDVIDWNGVPQTLWPDHCVQASEGAEFSKKLEIPQTAVIFRKGLDIEVDSYSAFYDNQHKNPTHLSEYLKAKGVKEVDVVGLAADFCVYYTAMDALSEGFSVNLHEKGTKAIDPVTYEKKKEKLLKNPKFNIIKS